MAQPNAPPATLRRPTRTRTRAAVALLALAVGLVLALIAWRTVRWKGMSDSALLAWVEKHPGDAEAQTMLGTRLAARGQNAAAAPAFEAALRSRPEDRETRRTLARLLLGLDRESDALRHLRELVRQDPDDAFAQRHLGEFYLGRGALSWASQALERAVAQAPDDADAWARLGATYLALKQPKKAVDALEKAARAAPKEAGTQIDLARAYLETGRRADAERLLRGQFDGPGGAQARYWLGVLFERSPDRNPKTLGTAAYWWAEACQKAPDAYPPRLALGKALLSLMGPNKALPHLERAAFLAPTEPEPLYYLARAYRAAGKPEIARTCLQRFRALTDFQQKHQALEFQLVQKPDDTQLRRRLSDLERRGPQLPPAQRR